MQVHMAEGLRQGREIVELHESYALLTTVNVCHSSHKALDLVALSHNETRIASQATDIPPFSCASTDPLHSFICPSLPTTPRKA